MSILLKSGAPALLGGAQGTPAWVSRWNGATALFDSDTENGKFWFGATYASEALLNTAAGIVKTSNVRKMGPYVAPAAPELMTNGAPTDLTGWTSGGGATLSVDANGLLITVASGVNPFAAHNCTIQAGHGYVASCLARNVTGPAPTLLKADVVSKSGGTGASNRSISLAFGGRASSTAIQALLAGFADGTYYYSNFSVKEAFALNGLPAGVMAAMIDVTMPASVSAVNTIFNAGDDFGNNWSHVRVYLDTDSHVKMNAYVFNAIQGTTIDLGAVTLGTRHKIWIAFNMGRWKAAIDPITDNDWVFGQPGSQPGCPEAWFGGDIEGNTFSGTVWRCAIWATSTSTAPTLYTFGDSLTSGAGVNNPPDRWTYKLAASLGANLVNTAVGGVPLDTIYANQVVPNLANIKSTDYVTINGGGVEIWGNPNAAAIVASMKQITDAIATKTNNWFVYGLLTAEDLTFPTSNTGYLYSSPLGAKRPIWDSVVATWTTNYGSRFGNIDALLKANYNPGNSQDVIDIGHGITPSTLRQTNDYIHPNEAGHLLIAPFWVSVIKAAGLFPK